MNRFLYIMYNKRSCVTGKALFDSLSQNIGGKYLIRRSCNNEPKKDPYISVRWGNSLLEKDGIIAINSKETVNMTADKLKMAEVFHETPSIRFPKCHFVRKPDNKYSLDDISNEEGMVFVRDSYDHVKYCHKSQVRNTDKYALEDLNRKRELRIHIINGKVLGVYEKVASNNEDKILKNHNSRFVRLDRSKQEVVEKIIGARPVAKMAVKQIGLDTAGVDVIQSNVDMRWYVNEVNSAPGLNPINVERWTGEIYNLIKERVEEYESRS